MQAGESVLLVGAGTGLDLKYIPQNVAVTATDITPAMLGVLQLRARHRKLLQVQQMDGQKLLYPNASFDAVVLHLILAVIPDPIACLREVERILKPNGRVVVFDKFLAENKQASDSRETFGRCYQPVVFRYQPKIFSYTISNFLRTRTQSGCCIKRDFQIYTAQKSLNRVRYAHDFRIKFVLIKRFITKSFIPQLATF